MIFDTKHHLSSHFIVFQLGLLLKIVSYFKLRFKTEPCILGSKLADVLEPAQERVKGAINHTMTRQVSALIKRIEGAIATLKEYYKVLKQLVA